MTVIRLERTIGSGPEVHGKLPPSAEGVLSFGVDHVEPKSVVHRTI